MAIYTTYAQFRNAFAQAPVVGTDGLYAWTGAGVVTNLGLTVPTLISAFPFQISVNATADPTPGVDRYDWYLSQRTDNPARQYLTISRADSPPATYSGIVSIGLTAAAIALGYAAPLSTTEILTLFTDVDIYVRNVSTLTVQHALLLEGLTGDGT